MFPSDRTMKKLEGDWKKELTLLKRENKDGCNDEAIEKKKEEIAECENYDYNNVIINREKEEREAHLRLQNEIKDTNADAEDDDNKE